MPSYRGLRPRILWGSTLQNAIDFGYPLDSVVTYSAPREGSETIQLISGIEDAFLAGEDHYLAGEVRWVPDEDAVASGSVRRASGWNDATTGWRPFLHYARAKNIVQYYPDSRNLLRSPSMDVTYPSTLWALGGDATSRAIANNDFGARITASSTPGGQSAYAVQTVRGILPGETLTLSVEYRTASMVGTVSFVPTIEYFSAAAAYLGATTVSVSGSVGWTRVTTATGVAPANTAFVNVTLYALLTSAGSSAQVWWRNAVLARRASDASAFIDNPYIDVYLVEPFRDPPTLERNAARRFPLLLRSTGNAFGGY